MKREYCIATTLFNVHCQNDIERYSEEEVKIKCEELTSDDINSGCGNFIKYNIVKIEDEIKNKDILDKLKNWIKGD